MTLKLFRALMSAVILFQFASPIIRVDASSPRAANAITLADIPPHFTASLDDLASPSAIASTNVITLTQAGFNPRVLTTTVDAQVTWYNATTVTHILRSGEHYRLYLPAIFGSLGFPVIDVLESTTCWGGTPATPNRLWTPTRSPRQFPESPIFKPDGAESAQVTVENGPAALASLTAGALFTATLAPGGTFTYTFTTAGTFPFFLVTGRQFDGQVIVQPIPLPPDPSTVAPSVDQSVPTNLGVATQFLYAGANPIQTGVISGTIDLQRVAVLRGRVLTSAGAPLPGSTISVLSHPEFGQTLSRADGMFDLAVNGGGMLTLNYIRTGYLPVQRQVNVPWRDYMWLPDVVMMQLDPNVTVIKLTPNMPMQIARSSVISDSDGMRQQTILFPQNTQAVMTLSNGTTQTLTSLQVRSTEYTVGESGPNAMPGELPPDSAYTYAFELSVDEALAEGAQDVGFSQPVIVYNDNFLSFPAGTAVPIGYYDRKQGLWLPAESGLVIKVISMTNGTAELDVDGSGIAASAAALASLGITDVERARLATLYTVGHSLWRVQVSHFSAWDSNWGTRCKEDDCVPPNGADPVVGLNEPDPDCQAGSVIECQNQILGEQIDLAGTPYTLNYRSDRLPGYSSKYRLGITLSGPMIHPLVKRIDLEVLIAGTRYSAEFAPSPNLQTTYIWDGRDAYGRLMQGAQPVQVRVGWVYEMEYVSTSRFGYKGNGIPISASKARKEFTLWKYFDSHLGGWQVPVDNLGGWNLSVQHTYDPISRLLYFGDGRKHAASAAYPIIEKAAGTGLFADPGYIAMGPDGSIYALAERFRVARWHPNGTKSIVAGTGVDCQPDTDPCGDGGPANQARISTVKGFAVGLDGSVYLADWGTKRVRRISPDGIITTVAGTGVSGTTGDGGPATQARLQELGAIAVGPDNSIYIAQEANNPRIRRVMPDGIITTFAGGGTSNASVITATEAIVVPRGMAVGADGSLYLVSNSPGGGARVRHVRLDGKIETIAGASTTNLGDGGPALLAGFSVPRGLALGRDGSIYVADSGHSRIRRIGTDSIVTTIGGNGSDCNFVVSTCGNDGPALQAQLDPRGLVVDPSNVIYFGESGINHVRRIRPVLPDLGLEQITFASEDGSELYVFSVQGRHLHTLDARTGALRYQLDYDSDGRLLTVTDGDGNVTSIGRNTSGQPVAIIGPYGHRTTLTLDANGHLASVADPLHNTVALNTTPTGLLSRVTTPRGFAFEYAYDDEGRLTRNQDPLNGFKILSDVQANANYTVTLGTALSRTTIYEVYNLPTGAQRRVTVDPAGLQQQLVKNTDATRTTTYPDGSVRAITLGPDPRFSMQAPLITTGTFTTTGGLTYNVNSARSISLTNPADVLSLKTITDQLTVNGQMYFSVYVSATRSMTSTTPMGRQIVTTVDSQSRPSQVQADGLLPLNYTYDARGRLTTISQGTRGITVTYNIQGFADTLTDPLSRTTTFAYDEVGRVITQTLPGGRIVGFAYDANGNLAALTPPGRPAHGFTYTPVDLASTYVPPEVGAGSNQTVYRYNPDHQVEHVNRPDGQTIDVTYDAAGRLGGLTMPGRTVTYGYDASAGNLKTVGVSGGESLSYTHDGPLMKTETWNGPVAGTISRGYDNNLRVASRSVNGANPMVFQYDNDSLLKQAGALSLNYSPQNGLPTGTALAGVTTAYDYNGYGEVISRTAAFTTGNLQRVQFTRDDLSRITSKTETIGGVTTVYSYTYDIADRLESEIVNGVTLANYSYDLNGNRLSVIRPGGTITATYDNQDRLLQYGPTTYTYTANGELFSRTTASQTTNYSYDALGNLLAVGLPNGTQIAYVVDGQNRRVGRKVNGVLTQGWLYQDQLKPSAELDGDGNVVATFVYATQVNVPDYMVKGGVTYRLLTDHLGSVRLVVNAATGQVVQRIDYDAFGRVLSDTNPGFQPFGFAGGLYDPAAGLVRFGARDYDAEIGRWTAKDPIGFGGGDSDFYLYVGNSPVSFVDPEGLDEDATCVGATCDGGSLLWKIIKKVGLEEAKSLTKALSKFPSFIKTSGRIVQRSIFAPQTPTVGGQFLRVAGGVLSMGIPVLQMTDCNTVEGLRSVVRQGRGGLANKNADRLYRAIDKY